MPSTNTTIVVLAAVGLAWLASKSATPKPDPIDVIPQGEPAGPPVDVLALTSQPNAGPVHYGVMRSDNTWTISTSAGSLVSQGVGEGSFLDRWLFYTQGGILGSLIASGEKFRVTMPPCAPGAPLRWCYKTTLHPELVRRAVSRAAALTSALARARSGA